MKKLRNLIKNTAKKTAGGIDIGLKLYNLGNLDGDILLVAPQGKFRKGITQLVEKLQENYNEDICIDYASWEDGFGEDGIILEQHLEKNIYSK